MQNKEDIWTVLMVLFYTLFFFNCLDHYETSLLIYLFSLFVEEFYIPPNLPIDEIRRVAFMNFGKQRKDFKHLVKRSLKIKEGDTHESIIQMVPNIEQFDAKDIECSIDTWLTPKNKVALLSVTYYIVCPRRTNYILTY